MSQRASSPFALFAYIASWLFKMMARVAISMMCEDHIADLLRDIDLSKYYHCETCLDWSVVSDASPSEQTTTSSFQQTPATSSSCSHRHVSRAGSNGFSIQLKCKDCGLLLLKQSTPASKKVRKTRPTTAAMTGMYDR